MKSKLLFLTFLMFLAVASTYAQTSSASQAGIAVQGIARDVNNTALASQSISLTFTIYYLDGSNLEVLIFEETQSLDTDAFGVFSHVINPGAVNNPKIANNQSYLRIKKATVTISDEQLRHVPYAISANNGVPTGSIMPYLGTTAPYGWALCDGTALPATATELIDMVGANAPNLQGMFLRGAGDDGRATTETVNLMAEQASALKSHLHDKGTLGTTTEGNHRHSKVTNNQASQDGDGAIAWNNTDGNEHTNNSTVYTDYAGPHSHTITGSTGSTGNVVETRPINYGVNYIIKL